MSDLNLEEYESMNYIWNKGYIVKKGEFYGAISEDKTKVLLDFKYRDYYDVFNILNNRPISLPPELVEIDNIPYLYSDDRIRYRDMLKDGVSSEEILENARVVSKLRETGRHELENNYYTIYYVDYRYFVIEIDHAVTEEELAKVLEKAKIYNDFCSYKKDIKSEIRGFLTLSDDESSNFCWKIEEAQTQEEVDGIYHEAQDLEASRENYYSKYAKILRQKRNNKEKNEDLEKRFGYTDDLYQFLFDALNHNDLFCAVDVAKAVCGCSVEEMSEVSRKLLVSYEDLAKVDGLSKVDLHPLLNVTYNPAFVKQLYANLTKNYNRYYPFVKKNIREKRYACIENPVDRCQFEMFQNVCRYFPQYFGELVSHTQHYRRTEACKNDHLLEQYRLAGCNKYTLEKMEDIHSLLCNDWWYESVFGKPVADEIYWAAYFIEDSSLQKYVLRNYKDILQSDWYNCYHTRWNLLKNRSEEVSKYGEKDSHLVDYYLESKGLAINDDGVLISLEDNKPVDFDFHFPPASDLTEDPSWISYYKDGAEYIGGLVFDAWPEDFYGGKAPQLWQIRQEVAEMGHPGIMKFTLAKYKDELQEDILSDDRSLYDILCEDIAEVEAHPEDYEHLTRLYDAILADNNIDIEALTEELETHFSK